MTSPTRAHFQSLVGEALTARLPSGEPGGMLTLTQVEGLPAAKDPESFRLVFKDEGSSGLAQGVYLLEHTRLPSEAIFIVPLGRDATGSVYEAVFNRG